MASEIAVTVIVKCEKCEDELEIEDVEDPGRYRSGEGKATIIVKPCQRCMDDAKFPLQERIDELTEEIADADKALQEAQRGV